MRVFTLKGRLLYRDPGKRPHPVGSEGFVDLGQLHNMERAVRMARDEGRIAVGAGREELATLRAMRQAIIKSEERKAPCRFASPSEEMKVRPKVDEVRRKRRRAEREARKLGREPKRKKRRKR